MPETRTEKELVTAAAAGDMFALEQLLCIHLGALERYLAPQIPADVGRQIGTDDLLQEVLAHAFRDIQRFEFREDASFLTWLKAIADHRLTDALKHVRRKKRGGDHHRLSKADIGQVSTAATLLDFVCHDSHLPENSVARREAEQAIHIALAGLPQDQREAIRANCLQGMSIEEVALNMGRTPDAVRGLIHRGKKNLAEAMGRSSHWLSSR